MKWIRITPKQIVVNGQRLPVESFGAEMLKEVYRSRVGDYPKFFKMDTLCRLGFLASELLLQVEQPRHSDCEDRAVLLFNRTGSLCDDIEYQATIQSVDHFFPSPAIFVYTLPNIVTGEIAIRNKYYGETMFCVLPDFDAKAIVESTIETFQDPVTSSVITGWIDCIDKNHFNALLLLVEKGDSDFTVPALNKLYHQYEELE